MTRENANPQVARERLGAQAAMHSLMNYGTEWNKHCGFQHQDR
eukprot:CAMPEP_0116846900 /NCGR_PEP_ID=MMETSP0418-20121206/14121_1 /TAXON_ID=1158023 /ORGANISM="Astrosyne radiata, Strain 13vi08-1A" /LENGTH=42 /DNA_ID= /DNA_START= /DNA_END= /DNA_ORIENTATION=